MRYSAEFIDKVREANNLVEIVGQYTELKGNGHRMMARCPFPDHSDKSPSFSVSEDSQLYYCYGCKKGGNVFTFLETYNGLSFPEAVEFLARRASIALPEREERKSGAAAAPREQKDLLLKLNKMAAVFYHQQLKALHENHPAKLYLKKRGLTDETVEKFRLGVALDDWQNLTKVFQVRRAPLALAESLGLIRPKKTPKPDDSHYDLFRDRLMFPIFSAANDVIGFGGRTLSDALPKYVNSSDSPLFNKSKVLYGIHETGRFIRALDSAIVVEGYMDAIALYTAGVKNVVAILGTAFTPEHAKVLKRYTLNVTMLLDGDEAGLNGAERSLPILLEAGLMPKGFALPDQMDPDDFVKTHGAAKLIADIERAPELFSLLLKRRWMLNYHGTSGEKVRITEEAAAALARSQNKQLTELYMLELAEQLEVDLAWVRRTFNSKNGTPVTRPNPVAPPPPEAPLVVEEPRQEKISLRAAPRDELFVLSLVVHHENLLIDLIEAGASDVLQLLSDAGVKRVISIAVEKYRLRPDSFATLAASLVDLIEPATALTSALVFQNREDSQESGAEGNGLERKLMADYLGAIRKRALKSQGKSLEKQIRDQPTNEKLVEFMALQRSRLKPTGEADK